MSDYETTDAVVRPRQERPVTKKSAAAIAEAILKTQSEVSVLPKNEANNYGNYMYVSIDTYYRDIAPLARRNGLFWTIKMVAHRQVDNDRIEFDFEIDLKYRDGSVLYRYSQLTVVHPFIGAQTTGSATSYAEKIFMRSEFKVPTGEGDSDMHSAKGGVSARSANTAFVPDPPPKPGDYAEAAEQRINRQVQQAELLKVVTRFLKANTGAASFERELQGRMETCATVEALEGVWVDNSAEWVRLQRGISDERALYFWLKEKFAERKAVLLTQPAATPASDTRQKPPFQWRGVEPDAPQPPA